MRKFILALPILVLTACGGGGTNSVVVTDEVEVDEARTINVYGDSTLTAEGAIGPQEFLAQMAGKDSLKTKLKATIIEACKKKGCWMTLDMGEGEEMLVRFKDYGFFVPTEGVDGKTVIIDGIAFTDTVSVAELRHLAEDAQKSEEEIAAITEPEIGINFEATGVIVEN